MKVKELIEALQAMPQDAEVYSYCDHGQTPETTYVPNLRYTPERLTYTLHDATIFEDLDCVVESGYEVEELNQFVQI